MKLVVFIDNKFQELRLAEQEGEKRREFSLAREAEQHALHAMRKGISTLLKWAFIPVLFVRYGLVLAGVVQAPEPVLVNLMTELKEKEDAKKLKKIGMAQIRRDTETVNPNQPA